MRQLSRSMRDSWRAVAPRSHGKIGRKWAVSRFLAAGAALLLAASAANAQTLQLWYPFEDDLGGNPMVGSLVSNGGATGTPGVVVGGGTYVPSTAPGFTGVGIGGQAIRFTNNDGEFIDTTLGAAALGFTNGNPTGYAASAWINMTANTGDSMVFGQLNGDPGGNGTYLHNGVRGGSYHQGHWGNDITVGSVTFDGANGSGNWHHVVWEYSTGVERIWVDGVDTGYAAVGPLTNPAAIKIGRSENGGGFDGVMDDVAVYSLGAGERLSLSQVQYLASGGDPTTLPAPVAPGFSPVGLGGGGDGFATMHITYVDNAMPDLRSVSGAAAALASGIRPVISENVPFANHADTGPGGSPGGGYSISHDAKLRYPGDTDGDTEDFAYVYNGYVDIPADGMYTFGVDGDDGQRLKLAGANFTVSAGSGAALGDTFGVEEDTGDAFTLARTFLPAGRHQLQVIGYERGGGAFNEVFAATGDTTNIADFRAIGHQAGPDAVNLGVTAEGWQVYTSPPAGPLLNNITDARNDLNAYIGGGGLPVAHQQVNFRDPDNSGEGSIGGDAAFDGNTPGDSDDFALFATATLVVPADGVYRIGFQGDDGGEFGFLTGADGVGALPQFGAILENATGASAVGPGAFGNPGDLSAVVCDCLTGNSRTVAEVFLTAGNYDVYSGFWERGGGAYFEVFGAGPNGALQLISGGGAGIVSDIDGLQWAAPIPEPSSFVLAGFGLAGLFVGLRRRRK